MPEASRRNLDITMCVKPKTGVAMAILYIPVVLALIHMYRNISVE